MRIAVDARPFEKERTGIGRYLEGILDSWLSEFPGDEVLLLSPRTVFVPPRLHGRVEILAPFLALPGTIWMQIAAPLEAERAGADIFFGPNAVVPIGSSIPRIATIHDLTPLLFPGWHNLKQRLGMVPFLPAVVREAHHLFCVSSATLHDLIRHFPEAGGKSSVVYNGLTPADKTRTGTALDLPETFILYLGTREPRKNLSRLVVAMEKIWSYRPSFPDLLVAGGSGWGMSEFEEQVRKSPHASRIRLLGYVEPAAAFELLRRASVLAYPSLYEGFGFPPIEAMECGTPVVASSSSSLPEICGDLALLPDPLRPGEIATALEQAVDDPVFRARARTEGPTHAASFTWQRAVRAMRPHFEAAVTGDPRPPA